MQRLKSVLSRFSAEEWLLMAALVAAGGFYDAVSCALAVPTAVLLIVRVVRNRRLLLRVNIGTVAVALIALGSLMTCLFAKDRGEALVGFLRFLPVALFGLLVTQEERSAAHYARTVSCAAVALGTLSAPLAFLPATERWFAVAGRLGGTFQYPNTFALFLTVGLLCALSAERLGKADIIISVLLGAEILLTGSRAVMPLAAGAVFVLLFFRGGVRTKIILAASAAAVILALVLLAPVLRDVPVLERLYAFSFSESTFAGRLLYWYDALPLLLRHPFGMGYLGWNFAQSTVQTGVYSVRYVHNDVLQLALDFGWLPCAAFVAAVVRSVFRRGKPLAFRLIPAVMLLHGCFDFDWQFTAVLFTLLLFLDLNTGRTLTLKKPALTAIGAGLLGALSLYFAVALGLSRYGAYEASDAMFGANTENVICLLSAQKTIGEQNKLADRLLLLNDNVLIAYDAKARYFFSEGNLDKVIHYKRKALEVAPLVYEEYEDYCDMLEQGVKFCRRQGDRVGAGVCQTELDKTRDAMSKPDERLSPLGKMIKE